MAREHRGRDAGQDRACERRERRDAVSGLKYLQVTSKRSRPGAKHGYVRTLVVETTHAPRWTRVIDRAGNRSKWRKLKRLR